MSTPDEKTVQLTLDAVERMMRLFHTERIIYLAGAIGALALLGYAAFLMIRSGSFSVEQAGLLFGAGGLFTVSGARVVFFLNRTYDLIEDIVRKLTGLDPRHER